MLSLPETHTMRMNYLVALLIVRGGETFMPTGLVTSPARPPSVKPTRRHLGVDEGLDFGVAPLVLAFAGVLAAAGKLQADAMSGDQGLAAFLRDGDGYNKSGYKPQKPGRDADAATAERLRRDLVRAADAGDASTAAALERELTAFLDARGLSYEDT